MLPVLGVYRSLFVVLKEKETRDDTAWIEGSPSSLGFGVSTDKYPGESVHTINFAAQSIKVLLRGCHSCRS